jgi:hypothetical protein
MNAADIMTMRLVTADPGTPLLDLVRLMVDQHVDAVPIIAEGQLVGIVTHDDVIRALASRTHATAALSDEDRRIRGLFAASLARPPWSVGTSQPTCIVDEGVVHLWGPVESEADRRALVAMARSLPGVRAVEDHMSVLRRGDAFDRPHCRAPDLP